MKGPVFRFHNEFKYDVLIIAGGFEERALTFIKKLKSKKVHIGEAILLKYKSQENDNIKNFNEIYAFLSEHAAHVSIINVDINLLDSFIYSFNEKCSSLSKKIANRDVWIDITAMSNAIICCSLRVIQSITSRINIIYTEANDYFPKESEWKDVIGAVQEKNYSVMANYLQTAGLQNIIIPTEFKGYFRPKNKTCLFIFAGYEPNRIKGLIAEYAPNAIIVFYGKSPHSRFEGRQNVSVELHKNYFKPFLHKEIFDTSTLDVDLIKSSLEKQYNAISNEYDIAITPQCSKMQAVASFLFWKEHQDVQLVFTTPVRFDINRYSEGSGRTYHIRKEL